MLSGKFRKKFSFIEQVAKLFIKIPPNILTLIGLLFGFIAFYFITINFLLGAIMVLISGFFDIIDGSVARLTGKTSKKGAYIDAMSDRITEFLIWLGIGVATNLWIYVVLSFFISQMISYAKARCGMEVSISNVKWPDFFERSERMLYTAVMLIIWIFYPIFRELIILFVILSLITLIQRFERALKNISAQ